MYKEKTIEEILYPLSHDTVEGMLIKYENIHTVIKLLKEDRINFAKKHCLAALEAASKVSLNYEIDEKAFDKMGEEIPSLKAEKQNKKSILNAYPLNNIK